MAGSILKIGAANLPWERRRPGGEFLSLAGGTPEIPGERRGRTLWRITQSEDEHNGIPDTNRAKPKERVSPRTVLRDVTTDPAEREAGVKTALMNADGECPRVARMIVGN